MIEGIIITQLSRISNTNGDLMHMLRSDDDHFIKFGEVYFSMINPRAIKAWRFHHRMTLNLAVPAGKVRLILFDDRASSTSKGQIQEIQFGIDNYILVTVPPEIWYGFQGLAQKPSLIANCSSIPHDPNEIERKDPFDQFIPYKWEEKN